MRLHRELHPDALAGRIHEAVSVDTEAMHVPEARRNTAFAHHDRDLVQRFREQSLEVPVALRAAQPGPRVALDRVAQVREA